MSARIGEADGVARTGNRAMTKRIAVVALLTTLLTVSTWGQRKVGELEVTLEKDRYVLYETVSGLVTNLGPGENFTVEFTDGHGRALVRKPLRRKGAKPTPFSFRIDFTYITRCFPQ